jgi:hypothetical protein
MAEIKQYRNSVEGLQTTDRAADALVRAGREQSANYGVAGAYINRIGEAADSAIQQAGRVATDYMASKEINDGAPAFMGVYAERQKTWEDQLKTDPNNPTLQAKFLEDTETQLQKFRDNFTTERGQKWAEGRIDAFRQHLVEKTTADISNVAASQVKVKWDQTTNASSAMAANDPASTKFLLENYNASIDGLVDGNTRLSASQSAQIKEQFKQAGAEKIVRAAVLSVTMKNPAAGEAMAKDPAFAKYIDGVEIRQQAQLADRVNKAEARAAKSAQHEQQIMANDQAISQIVGGTLPEQPGGPLRVPPNSWVNLRKAAQQEGMKPERIEATVRYLKAIETGLEKVKSDPDVLEDFDKRLGTGTLTVDQIRDAAATRMLSPTDTRRYGALVNMKDPVRVNANRYFNDGVMSFKSSITKSDVVSGVPDPEGDQRYGQFRLAAREGYEQAYRDGGLAGAQKWVKTDLPELARPFVGKAGVKSSVDRVIRQSQTGTSVVPNVLDADMKQRPGETTDQYLKRRGGGK